MSTHSIYNRVNALRSFFGWLHRQGYTDEHVLRNLKQPKTADMTIKSLTTEEVGRIFSTINPSCALGARNSAIISLMLDTGLRLSEVAGLRDDDIHFDSRYVKVQVDPIIRTAVRLK